jgi:hypothetical protein
MATIKQISEQILNAGMDANSKLDSNMETKYTEDILPGGPADNISDDKFSAEALAKGIKHEMEHTENEEIAKEIAKDHLTESADYYDKLEAMKLSGVDISVFRLMAAGK